MLKKNINYHENEAKTLMSCVKSLGEKFSRLRIYTTLPKIRHEPKDDEKTYECICKISTKVKLNCPPVIHGNWMYVYIRNRGIHVNI